MSYDMLMPDIVDHDAARLTPRGDNVLLVAVEEVRASGLVTPRGTGDAIVRWSVVSAGPRCSEVAPGDVVLARADCGDQVWLRGPEGRLVEYRMSREGALLGVCEEADG